MDAKVIVMTQFDEALEEIHAVFEANNLEYLSWAHDEQQARMAFAKQRLQRSDLCGSSTSSTSTSSASLDANVLTLPLSIGYFGHNLTQANHIIFMEPVLDRSMRKQAVSRIHRMGQVKQCHVHTLRIAETVEEAIHGGHIGSVCSSKHVHGNMSEMDVCDLLQAYNELAQLHPKPPQIQAPPSPSRAGQMQLSGNGADALASQAASDSVVALQFDSDEDACDDEHERSRLPVAGATPFGRLLSRLEEVGIPMEEDTVVSNNMDALVSVVEEEKRNDKTGQLESFFLELGWVAGAGFEGSVLQYSTLKEMILHKASGSGSRCVIDTEAGSDLVDPSPVVDAGLSLSRHLAVEKLLEQWGLSQYSCSLIEYGCDSLSNLVLVEKSELEVLNIKPIHQKRLIAEVAQLHEVADCLRTWDLKEHSDCIMEAGYLTKHRLCQMSRTGLHALTGIPQEKRRQLWQRIEGSRADRVGQPTIGQ